jgi:hypothetical protein
MIGTLALLTCLVCPVLETIDSWDPPIQTGNDTEYALVVLALCVGSAYLFARFFLDSPLLSFLAKRVPASGARRPSFPARYFTLRLADATSPPALPLRI